MATIMDVSALYYFLPFVIFLFIFVASYGFLSKIKILGDNTKLNLIAALCIGLLTIFIGDLIDILSFTIPWLFFIVIALLMIFGLFLFFKIGKTEEESYAKVWDLIGSTPVLIIMLIIIFIAITQVFESTISPYSSEDGTKTPTSETLRTLTHPRILSALFILIISGVVVRYLVDLVKS
ncbi:MAG TPA: hypothetical protein VJB89_02125 [Candidatus Nanoarchaeia archaeon]|nr:hypothetical protein [Candidatus Nanoarchaeia archaeon]